MSRRRLLRTAVIGAGAAAVAATLPGRPAYAAGAIDGDVTLGALLITFVGAPLGNKGATHWQVTRERTDTVTVSSKADTSVSFSFDQTVSGTAFGIGISGGTSQKFKQSTSVTDSAAVVLRSTETITLTSQAAPGGDGYARPGDTTFYLLAKPKVNLRGKPNTGFRFKFLNAQFVLIANLDQLLHDPFTRNPIGAGTADSFAAQYPFRDGSTSGLNLPSQFKLRKTISAGPSTSPYQWSDGLASGTTISAGGSETVGVDITESITFNNNPDPTDPNVVKTTQMFSAGQSFAVTHSAAQERTEVTILTTSGELSNDHPRIVNNVYKVKRWKTLIMSDEGLISSGRLVAQGRVTAPDGTPLAGVVGLLSGSASIEAMADAGTGDFALYSPTPLPPGSYPVVCGDASTTIGPGGTAYLQPTPGTELNPVNPILIES
ncbi:MAG: hypothetical protein AUI14_24810 [Actinobacteria bacterium 13_2_20CM_2_71_6]|nr:MAG: hypothetical protein AUI14_24810 [Actinobacteria bacterium 13_2_20CM_2_71_6]